jgi:hypothetical protein
MKISTTVRATLKAASWMSERLSRRGLTDSSITGSTEVAEERGIERYPGF